MQEVEQRRRPAGTLEVGTTQEQLSERLPRWSGVRVPPGAPKTITCVAMGTKVATGWSISIIVQASWAEALAMPTTRHRIRSPYFFSAVSESVRPSPGASLSVRRPLAI